MKKLLRLNIPMLLAMLALCVVGVVFVRSAGSARSSLVLQNAWRSHAFTAMFGLGAYFACACTDYRKMLYWTAVPFFGVALVLLMSVLLFGSEIYGGRRWLWFFQPSEIAKLSVIFLLSQILPRADFRRAKHLAVGLALVGVPAALILAEPDLGTALVVVPTGLAMLLAARVCRKLLVPLLVAGFLAAGAIVGAVWCAEHASTPERRAEIYRRIPLRPHQLKRLKVFVAPESDPYAGGWNYRQAMLSIGSGSLHGKGVGKGDVKFLGYLPPSVSMNDFIFAVLGEEAGFVGTCGTLALFAVLAFSCLWVAARSADERGRLLALGVAVLVFTHVYVNVAMSIGLMPITGLPLPFVSAGKTFLVVIMAALGAVQSVNIHKGEEK